MISLNQLIPEEVVNPSTPSTSVPNSTPFTSSQPTSSNPSQTLPILSTTPLPIFSRAQMLLYRRQSSPDNIDPTHNIALPFTCFLADNAIQHRSRNRRGQHTTTPPITGDACPAKAPSKRTGRRVKFRSFDGSPTFFCKPKKNRRRYNSEIAPRKKKPKPSKHKTTPPLAYHAKLRIGALNVQGMAETLKLKSILQIMNEQNLDVVMLSETRSTSYYSYSSEGFLVVLSGNTRDRRAGVGQ